MPGYQYLNAGLGLALVFAAATSLCQAQAADLSEIVSRATATLKSDWSADPDYAYTEIDETKKGDKTTGKTYKVFYIDGSDYNLPIADDGKPLSPEREKIEIEKLKAEAMRRKSETPDARRKRIEKFKKQRDEDEALVLDFPDAFNFEFLREETVRGYPSYVLSGTPKKRTGQLSLAAKVLSGMRGTVWVDKEHFHAVRVECDVMTPVPIYGILAKVLPGTHIEFAMAPVTNSIWLIGELSMDLRVSKLIFKSTQLSRSTFTDYKLNTTALNEILSAP
jgi:outer membrane lipoprotein-sorting protein